MKIYNGKNNLQLSYLAMACCIPFSNLALADTINVYNAAELQSALLSVAAGDEIIVNPGEYTGSKGSSTSGSSKAHFYSDKSGTESDPIILRSKWEGNKQILQGSSVESGYVFYLKGSNWIIEDLKFSTAQKGIMLEGANHNTLDNIEVFNIGAEAVHFRYFSSYNTLSNCYIHNTGKRSGGEGFGEAVYVGTHDGHTSEKLDHSHYNRIGGCSIGPNITAEAFDVKSGTIGTVIESNYINGKGIIGASGDPAADSFIDLKGTDVIIRNNIMDFNNDDNFNHGIFTYEEHRNSNIYNNEFTLGTDMPTFKLLEETVHAQNNTRLDGGEKVVQADYQLKKIDDVLDQSIEQAAYSYHCFDELTSGCGSIPEETDPEITDPEVTDPEETDPEIPTPESCSGVTPVTWGEKTEIELAEANCISFSNDLSNQTLQVWDSDENSSCNFRGEITSIENTALSESITENYHSFSTLSGKTFIFETNNDCQYIKVKGS